MSVLAAAAIGAGISALGGLASSAMTNNANANLDNVNRQWQERMWHEANAYNAPVEQRKRLEAAGINPALAFQNGNNGVAASTPTPNQHTPADYSALGAGLNAAAQYYLQAKQSDANTDLIKSQAEAQKIDNQTLLLRRIAEWEKLLKESEKLGADTDSIKWQMDKDMALYDAYSKKAYAEVMNLRSQSALNDVLAQYNTDKNAREAKMLEPTINQLKSIASSNNSLALLNKRNANIVPRLSNDQIEQISQAFVDEKLKDASAEEIAGFGFKGTTIQEIKMAVKDWLKSGMK